MQPTPYLVVTTRALLTLWPFLTIKPNLSEEPFPLRGHVLPEGPSIEFCPDLTSYDKLDDPSLAYLWLAPCLMQIATKLIQDDLSAEGARLASDRWVAFRNEAEIATVMDWAMILDLARRESVDYAAEHVAVAMILESRFGCELSKAIEFAS